MNDKIKYKITSDAPKSGGFNIKDFFIQNKHIILNMLNKAGKNRIGGVFDPELNKIIKITEGNSDEIYLPFEIIWTKYLWVSHPFIQNSTYFILSGDELNQVFRNFLGASMELGVKEQYNVVFSKNGVFGSKISIDKIPNISNDLTIEEYLDLFSRVAQQYQMYNSYLMGENGFFNQDINNVSIYDEQIKLYKKEDFINKLNEKINEVIKIVMEKYSQMKLEFFVVFF
jgi:hypothetical protein